MMGDFKQKPNSGSLFKNKKKETDKHPDYTGEINVDGKLLRLSAWIKDGKNGKWMSLSVSEQRQKTMQAKGDVYDEDTPPF